MATVVPAGCWPTARVDGTADFTGVDRVFGYGSLVWKPPCKEEIVKKKHTAYIKGCVGGYGVLAGLHRVPEFGSRCTYTVCILFLLFHLFFSFFSFPLVGFFVLPGPSESHTTLLYERWHRRFWQTSVDHRGTPAKPGRVCTILPATHPDLVGEGEGSTAGMVYEIADIDALLPELDFREKNGYTRTVVPYYLKQDDDEPAGKAILYFAQQGDDPAYTGPAPVEETAAIIARSVGSVQLQLLPTHVFGIVFLLLFCPFFLFFCFLFFLFLGGGLKAGPCYPMYADVRTICWCHHIPQTIRNQPCVLVEPV